MPWIEHSSPKIIKCLILYNPNLKIFLEKYIFSRKKPFLKKFLIFGEMELSGPKIKKVLMFSQKNVFLYISENGTV